MSAGLMFAEIPMVDIKVWNLGLIEPRVQYLRSKAWAVAILRRFTSIYYIATRHHNSRITRCI